MFVWRGGREWCSGDYCMRSTFSLLTNCWLAERRCFIISFKYFFHDIWQLFTYTVLIKWLAERKCSQFLFQDNFSPEYCTILLCFVSTLKEVTRNSKLLFCVCVLSIPNFLFFFFLSFIYCVYASLRCDMWWKGLAPQKTLWVLSVLGDLLLAHI